MKQIDLTDYEANVFCPHCQDEGDIWSSSWLVDTELMVFQYCQRCHKAWQETWELKKVEIGETQNEDEELDFLHRHPECSA